MKIYITYNRDDNNDYYSFYGLDVDKAEAEKKYKTEYLKEFLSVARSDIEYLILAEADVSDADYLVMIGEDEDCYFNEDDFASFAKEVNDDPKRKLIYEVSGDQAGMQLHQYWIDNQAKYPNIPEDIAGEDNYYFDFIDNLQVEDSAAYDKLVADFIKSGKFKATV